MAARSPSPNPSRPTNPNSKTPESGSLLRRSGGSILSKPSNSQEIFQRGSGSKPVIGVRSSFEQNENEREPSGLRAARARSPAMASKGSKNFMAPTISAFSKTITASPRKKILTERNEVNLHPDSLQFALKEDDGSKCEMGFSDREEEVEEIGAKAKMGLGSQEALVKKEPRKVDPEIKDGLPLSVPLFSSSVISPLDADPSLPPYDPKTNYLSPRPRFLHYKPNPRIEHYLQKERDMDSFEVQHRKWLEDTFSTESYEETSDDSEEAESSCLQKNETHVSEPEPSSINPKPHSFLRSKLVPVLLVMVITCISVPLSDSPIISSSSSVIKDQSFSKLYGPVLRVSEDSHLRDYLNKVAAVAHVNIGVLANRFWHWSVNSIPYLTTMPFVPKEIDLFHPDNLTASALEFSYVEMKPNEEEKSLVSEREQANEMNLDEELEKSSSMAEPEGNVEMELTGGVKRINVSEDMEETEMVKSSEVEVLEVAQETDSPVVDQFGQKIKEEVSVIGEKQEEIHLGHEVQNFEELIEEEHKEFSHDLVAEHEEKQNRGDLKSLAFTEPADFNGIHFDPSRDDQRTHDLKPLESVNYGLKDAFCAQTLMGIGMIAAMLAVTVGFLCIRQKQSPSFAYENWSSKKVISVSGSCERPLYHNFSMDVEMMGDSSPSEVSSSLHNTSTYVRKRMNKAREEETLSNENRLRRRESTVSTPVSYGSFMTYERLSAKKNGGRDEGEVTPVRRSSRIRQLTSS